MSQSRLHPLALAPLAFLLYGCPSPSDTPPSGGGSSSVPGEEDLPLADWVFQLEALPGPGYEGWYEEMYVGTAHFWGETLLFLDLNFNHSYEEGPKLAGPVEEGVLLIDAEYYQGGQTVHVKSALDFLSPSHLAGNWTRTIDDNPPEFYLVGVKLGNSPQIDMAGDWDFIFTVETAAPQLNWPEGSTEEFEWNISQISGGIHSGLLRFKDAQGDRFLGVVDSSQITIARRYMAPQGLTTYTSHNFNTGVDTLVGQLSGLVESTVPHEVSWSVDATRQVEGAPSSLMLIDDRPESQTDAIQVRLEGPEGSMLVTIGGQAGASVVVPLSPGTWNLSRLGAGPEACVQVHAAKGDDPQVLTLSALPAR